MLSPRGIIVIAIISVSTSSILIRLSEAPTLVLATYRLGMASLFMIAAAVHTRQLAQLKMMDRKDSLSMIVSGFFLFLHFATWITSLSYTTVATSVIIVNTSPILVALLSYVFLQEGLTLKTGVGIILSMTGAILIGLSDPVEENMVGIFLAFMGAIGLAVYLVIGRNLRRKLGTFSYVSGVYSVSFGFLFLSTLLFRQSFSGYPVREYVLFFLLALIPSSIGHTLYNYCLKYLKAAVVSVSLLGEPVCATIMAMIFFTEIPTIHVVGGGILVVGGIYLAIKR
jgi:drug/metabolite transporter (DMT)-like permease